MLSFLILSNYITYKITKNKYTTTTTIYYKPSELDKIENNKLNTSNQLLKIQKIPTDSITILLNNYFNYESPSNRENKNATKK